MYNEIAEALLNNSDEWTDKVAIRVGKPLKPNIISSLKDMQHKLKEVSINIKVNKILE